MARKATEYVQFKLRIREALRRRIEAEAKKKNHSANNEAVSRLEQSFANEGQDVLVAALVGGGQNANLLRMTALKLQQLEAEDPHWRRNLDRVAELLKGLAVRVIDVDPPPPGLSVVDVRPDIAEIGKRLSATATGGQS